MRRPHKRRQDKKRQDIPRCIKFLGRRYCRDREEDLDRGDTEDYTRYQRDSSEEVDLELGFGGKDLDDYNRNQRKKRSRTHRVRAQKRRHSERSRARRERDRSDEVSLEYGLSTEESEDDSRYQREQRVRSRGRPYVTFSFLLSPFLSPGFIGPRFVIRITLFLFLSALNESG